MKMARDLEERAAPVVDALGAIALLDEEDAVEARGKLGVAREDLLRGVSLKRREAKLPIGVAFEQPLDGAVAETTDAVVDHEPRRKRVARLILGGVVRRWGLVRLIHVSILEPSIDDVERKHRKVWGRTTRPAPTLSVHSGTGASPTASPTIPFTQGTMPAHSVAHANTDSPHERSLMQVSHMSTWREYSSSSAESELQRSMQSRVS